MHSTHIANSAVRVSEALIRCSASNNVIVRGNPVMFYLAQASAKSGRTYKLTNFDGTVVRMGPAVKALTLTNLPVGWYRLKVGAAQNIAQTSFAVVYPVRHLPHGPIAVDAASAWLVPPSKFRDAAHLLKLAGLGWVRERLAWREVEPKPGLYTWGRYDACTFAESSEGIRIDDIFHDVPTWARHDHAINRFPDDLRTAYSFCETLAKHFHSKVEAWEVWNEADGGFSVDNADQYGAFLKACYLGFKAGDPNVKVLQVSMANGVSRYEAQLYQNQTRRYFDVFNYHEYLDPMLYSARAQGHFALLRRAKVLNKPVWVTEAGVNDGETGDEQDSIQAKEQADFIPRSFAMSLASGTTRHFFFVLPHYLEPGVEWGVLTKQMLPYPGYCALAACAHFLGSATYLGRLRVRRDTREILQAFENDGHGVVVLWRNGGAHSFKVPSVLVKARFYNCVGTPVPVPTKLGDEPLFALCPLLALKAHVSTGNKLRAPFGHSHTRAWPPVIVPRVILPDNTIARDKFAYLLHQPNTPFTLQVYNFAHQPFHGEVHLQIPAPWRLKVDHTLVDIPPMGLKTIPGVISLPDQAQLRRIHLTGFVTQGGTTHLASSRVSLTLLPDPASLRPVATVQTSDAVKWTANSSVNCTTEIAANAHDEFTFTFNFKPTGDKWAYPRLTLNSSGDLSRINAVSLDYRTDHCASGTVVRLMVGKSNGSVYFTPVGFPPSTSWKHIAVPFSWLVHGTFSPSDAAGRMTGRRLKEVLVGLNTPGNFAVLQIRNVRLIQLRQ